MNLHHLEPSLLWKHFFNLCAIPRISRHEAAAVEYVKRFASELNLETHIDSPGNILVRKPATTGFEHSPVTTLQSHLDMVPQKNSDTQHDFLVDPIQPVIDGEWIKAQGTTLGADNGIGVAAALAVLEDSSLVHGPLEALFTIDEETGMTGALNLDKNLLKGDILINLDTEEEGELCTGCAGGVNATVKMPFDTITSEPDGVTQLISIKGLRGGHSGLDINLGRGNALRILARLLSEAEERFGPGIADFHGGTVRNAIPREAFTRVVVAQNRVEEFTDFCTEFERLIRSELKTADPDIRVNVEKSDDRTPEIMNTGLKIRFLRTLNECPNGVIRMNEKIKGVVESSSNLSVVKIENGTIQIEALLRSSSESGREMLCRGFESVFGTAQGELHFSGEYPGWQPDPDSYILNTMKQVYHCLFGKEPEVRVVHAGLECGIIGSIYPLMQLISCGPTICFPHSPDESVNIASVEKFWRFLCATLKQISGSSKN